MIVIYEYMKTCSLSNCVNPTLYLIDFQIVDGLNGPTHLILNEFMRRNALIKCLNKNISAYPNICKIQ